MSERGGLMEQDIIFKNENGKIYIIAKDNLTYESFIKSLKNRLERLYFKDDLLRTSAIIDIKNISLDTRKILNLFDVLSMCENIYVSKIIYSEKKNKNIILHEGNIRAGEVKLFSNNTLLIGNINKGGKVIINGNLYVIGKVSGDVEMKNVTDKLMASNIDKAHIKICSYEKQFEEILENGVIKINKDSLIEEKYVDGRGGIYGKSNCNYIW